MIVYNPDAKRYTFADLRNDTVNNDPYLRDTLDRYYSERDFADKLFAESEKSEEDARLHQVERQFYQERIDYFNQLALNQIISERLLNENYYGFGVDATAPHKPDVVAIPPHYWLFLRADMLTSEASGHGLHYVGIFFQEAADVPEAVKQAAKDKSYIPAMEDKLAFYLSPYAQLIMEASRHFNIDPQDPPLKKTIITWLEDHIKALGINISPRQIDNMATMVRPPEAQKGGKPKAGKR